MCPTLVRATHQGHPRTGARGDAVPAPAAPQRTFQTCTAKVAATFHQVVTCQPASHYWPFQWAELGVFVAAAAALCALSYWWVGHRLT
ncbi:MAG TPA: hypothetical protein VHW47_07030 [Acidimicrobiales bacterium]|jgi:hypothetical protein|nr:hypothetical protein [Acidimicrobiales bacterium]